MMIHLSGNPRGKICSGMSDVGEAGCGAFTDSLLIIYEEINRRNNLH